MAPSTNVHLSPGDVVAHNYRISAPLGAGGMGTVYLGENVTLQQRVVVKVLRGGPAGAGAEEAQMLADLQHPNVVSVYARDNALDSIVMEFLDGESLGVSLERGIDPVSALRLTFAVAEALAAVHKRGLVHRDIKPDNVMLSLNTRGGRLVDWLKLIDFGLALKAGKVPAVPMGTPAYCGPEQFSTDEPAHPANDVYALGVMLFQLLSGVLPFEGSVDELAEQHLRAQPSSLVEMLVGRAGCAALERRTLVLLETLDALLLQMLAKQVSARPSAEDVARRLAQLERGFVEADTFGGAATPIPLTVVAGRPRTSVLTPSNSKRVNPNQSR